MAVMDDNPIVTCEINQSLVPGHQVRANRRTKWLALLVVVLSLAGT
jgi:hypothetical protein